MTPSSVAVSQMVQVAIIRNLSEQKLFEVDDCDKHDFKMTVYIYIFFER